MGESEEIDNIYKSDVNLSSDYSFTYNILMQVFPYLDHKDLSSCSDVSGMWKSVVGEAPLWSKYTFRCCGFHLDKELLNKRVIFFKKVKLIDVIEYHLKDCEADVFTAAINLEELELFKCNFNFNERLKSIFKNLNVLKITQIYDDAENDNPFTLNFFENLSNLKELSITTKYSVSVDHFEPLEQLEHLYLDASFKKGFFTTNLNFLKNLKSFGVGFTFYEGTVGILAECLPQLVAVVQHMPNLNKLQLFGLENDFSILETVSNMQQIDTLELGIIQLWHKSSNPLQMCSNIKKLSIQFVLLHGNFLHIGDIAEQNSTLFDSVKELRDTLQEFTWIFHQKYMEESEELLALKNNQWRTDFTAVWSDTVDFEPKNYKLTKVAKIFEIRELFLENLEELLRQQLPRTKIRVLSEFPEGCEFCPKLCRDVVDLHWLKTHRSNRMRLRWRQNRLLKDAQKNRNY